MSTERKGWIGVDLDGTLAQYTEWKGITHIGEPVPIMLNRVKRWLDEGSEVRISTARVYPLDAPVGLMPVVDGIATYSEALIRAWQSVAYIRSWCEKHIGRELHVTCMKDYSMAELWDDRARGVLPNRGVPTETIPAMYLKNLVEALGVSIADGDSYESIVAQATKRINRMSVARNAIQDLHAHVDGARDALVYVKTLDVSKQVLPQQVTDFNRARTLLEKAMPHLELALKF